MSNSPDQSQTLNLELTKLQSMTGFGRAQVQFESTVYLIELKSVNSRFLDINFRGASLGATLEHHIRQALQRHFKRGKLDVFSGAIKSMGAASMVDESLFQRMIESGRSILRAQGLDSGSNLDAVTRIALERVFLVGTQPTNTAPVVSFGVGGLFDEGSSGFQQLLAAADAACKELGEMRQREGEKLRIKIEEYCLDLLELVGKISERSTNIASELLERGRQRVTALVPTAFSKQGPQQASQAATDITSFVDGEMGDARLLQELAIIADKADISEELVRLSSHLKAIHKMLSLEDCAGRDSDYRDADSRDSEHSRGANGKQSVLEKPNSIGKKIDFLLQETQRELNTLSVKCQNLEVVNWCVSGKLLVEQMKEQIQNIE